MLSMQSANSSHILFQKEKSMKHQAMNPYLPAWEYIPDGEPYVFGDRV